MLSFFKDQVTPILRYQRTNLQTEKSVCLPKAVFVYLRLDDRMIGAI